jgi:hypothetical protein
MGWVFLRPGEFHQIAPYPRCRIAAPPRAMQVACPEALPGFRRVRYICPRPPGPRTARSAGAFGLGASTTKLSNSIAGIGLITASSGKLSEGSYQGRFSIAPTLKRLGHQLSYLFSAQGDKRTVLVLVELGTKIQSVYSWIISIDNQEVLRFAETTCAFLRAFGPSWSAQLLACHVDGPQW